MSERSRRRLRLLGVAVVFTLLNALKPMHVDDTFYFFHARQVAAHPSDPHGFLIYWHEHPEPADDRVAPPVLPYWLAPALPAFPDTPFVWKLWLFPFAAALALSLEALLRRFAPGLEWPLLMLTLASPAFLPSLNLMLDVPAVALAALALVLFIRAGEASLAADLQPDERVAAAGLWAAAAGVAAGLAAQTKYTGLLAPATVLGYALVNRKLRLGALATGVAVTLFVSWEVFMSLRYGESHFLRHAFRRAEPFEAKLPLLLALASVLGATAPGLWVLGFVARGGRARAVAAAAGFTTAACLAALLWPPSLSSPPTGWPTWTLPAIVFGVGGAGLLADLGRASARLLSRQRRIAEPANLFLILWLALEAAGHLVLSPFPAVRRVLGLNLVATLILGRLAARACRKPARRRLAWSAACVSAALGALVWVVDVSEALAERSAAEGAASWLADSGRAQARRVFFVGHWGFQYYAERAGMRAAVSGRFRTATPLVAGDYLVVPSPRVDQPQIRVDRRATEIVHEIAVDDAIPWATLPGFYVGETLIQRRAGPRVEVTIYRVTQDFTP